MARDPLIDHMLDHLQHAYTLEKQSLQSLESLIHNADDLELKLLYQRHREQTLQHALRIRDRLEAHHHHHGNVTAAMSNWFKGLGESGRGDHPDQQARYAYLQEQAEIASYELLERFARRAGDEETSMIARLNKQDEIEMARRIGDFWERVVDRALQRAGVTQDASGAQTGAYGVRADAAERGRTWTGASTEADMGIGYPGDHAADKTPYDRVQGRIPEQPS